MFASASFSNPMGECENHTKMSFVILLLSCFGFPLLRSVIG